MKWQIPYQGANYEFDDGRVTASEARLQKRLTGGKTPSACDAARSELDPDAWVAALAIAKRRAGEDIEKVTIDEDALVLSDIIPATEKAYRAELALASAVVEAAEQEPEQEPEPEDAPAARKPRARKVPAAS